MKKKTHLIQVIIPILLGLIILNCNSSNNEYQWQSLFNGKNLEGWVPKINHHEFGDNYANTFRVKEGKILVCYDDYEEFGERFGHLYYREPFASYHLKFEYKFTDQWMEDAPWYAYRNSGIMFHSQDPKTILKDQDWPIAIEFQFLAEEKEGESRPTANVCTPGTEIFYNGELYPEHCLGSSAKTYQLNRWIKGELIVHSDSLITHIINGDTVLQYTKPQIGGGVVNNFDPTVKIDGKPLKSGYIALQSEGQGIMFKNIKIKELE